MLAGISIIISISHIPIKSPGPIKVDLILSRIHVMSPDFIKCWIWGGGLNGQRVRQKVTFKNCNFFFIKCWVKNPTVNLAHIKSRAASLNQTWRLLFIREISWGTNVTPSQQSDLSDIWETPPQVLKWHWQYQGHLLGHHCHFIHHLSNYYHHFISPWHYSLAQPSCTFLSDLQASFYVDL